MIIDFHSHFLPSIDDGSSNADMSIEMLKMSIKGDVEQLIATPHFYVKKNIGVNDFLKLRDNSYGVLKQCAFEKHFEMPNIKFGAEVHFDKKLRLMSNYKRLCIQDTNIMLVEMPYSKWDNQTIEELYKLSISGIRIVIAHVDRYYRADPDDVYKLFELDLMFQVNTEVFDKRNERQFLKELIESGRTVVVGSDMHNITDRATNIKKAYAISKRKLKTHTRDLFYDNAKKLLAD